MSVKEIGSVLRSTSHTEYIVQILNPRKNLSIADYSLGSFVFLGKDIVAIVYDTEIFNPNALSLSEQKLEFEKFAPDLLEEIDILLKVLILGKFDINNMNQSIPTEIIEAGERVSLMTKEQIKAFHLTSNNKLQLKYLTNLKEYKLAYTIFENIYKQLQNLLDSKHLEILKLLQKNMLWERVYK